METDTIDFDDKVIANDAYLVGGGKLHFSLMAGGVNLQGDDLALLGNATRGDIANEVWHLALTLRFVRGIEALDQYSRAWVFPFPLLGVVPYLLPGEPWLLIWHSFYLLSSVRHQYITHSVAIVTHTNVERVESIGTIGTQLFGGRSWSRAFGIGSKFLTSLILLHNAIGA